MLRKTKGGFKVAHVNFSDHMFGSLHYVPRRDTTDRVEQIFMNFDIKRAWEIFVSSFSPEDNPVVSIVRKEDGLDSDCYVITFKSGLVIEDSGRVLFFGITDELIRKGLKLSDEQMINTDIDKVHFFLNSRCGSV